MGNIHQGKQKDQFTQIVKALKHEKNKQSVLSVDAKPDQRYRNLMLESLKKSQMNEFYKINMENCIRSKISRQELSSVLIILNNVKSNDIPTQILNIKSTSAVRQRTKNVEINFETLKNKRMSRGLQKQNLEIIHLQDTIEGRTKTATNFLTYQISKSTHPFFRLCQKYSKLLQYDETLLRPCSKESQYESWQSMFQSYIKQFCLFLIRGCLQIYKKWLITYTGINEKKYQKWIFSLVINQIWSVSNHNLYRATKRIINQNKIPLKFSIDNLATNFSMGFIKPEIFNIDKQLQIQGHYFSAVYDLSELSNFSQPTLILKQLQEVKSSICLDIDNYHKLSEKNQIYQVNGDNIMGITAYLISKVALKIHDIHLQMLFLRIVYGEPIYYSMDVSSYMFSTIVGALQFLESGQFRELMKIGMENYIRERQENSKTVTESKETCGSFIQKKALEGL